MKLENQVCSLELAKRLKDLGVEQESLFTWIENKSGWHLVDTERINEENECCSAFSVPELGDMLPFAFWKDGVEYWLVVERLSHGWWIRYDENARKGKTIAQAVDPTEVNARAKMLIYLLENKLISLNTKEEQK